MFWHGLTYWNDDLYSGLEDVDEEDLPLHAENFFEDWNANDVMDGNNHVPMTIFDEDEGTVY